MNTKEKRKKILAKLQSRGVFSDHIDEDFIASFKELYEGEINNKIALYHQDPSNENLIKAAPELLQIAEMFRDHMVGKDMERSMVFDIVSKVLQDIKQESEQEETMS